MDHKYTDSHVRSDPSLRLKAIEYLVCYTGDFDFLLGAKRSHQTGYDLNTGTIRGVLNCMLVDPSVINMPTPAKQQFDAGDADQVPYRDRPVQPQVRTSPFRLPLRTTWKKPFAVSLRAQGKLIHQVNHEVSLLVKYVYTDHSQDQFRWQVNWFCTRALHINPAGNYSKNYRLLHRVQAKTLLRDGLLAELPELGRREWKACGKCEEASPNLLSPSA